VDDVRIVCERKWAFTRNTKVGRYTAFRIVFAILSVFAACADISIITTAESSSVIVIDSIRAAFAALAARAAFAAYSRACGECVGSNFFQPTFMYIDMNRTWRACVVVKPATGFPSVAAVATVPSVAASAPAARSSDIASVTTFDVAAAAGSAALLPGGSVAAFASRAALRFDNRIAVAGYVMNLK
jgi:hypothetical protein